MKLFPIITSLVAILSIPVLAQESTTSKFLYTPNELYDIMDKSKLTYEIGVLDSTEMPDKNKFITLSDQLYITGNEGSRTLKSYELSEEAGKILEIAEGSFIVGEYDKALALYRKLLEVDRDYNKAYSMIGDVYYMKENYDSAKYYFRLAIEKNTIDYAAHWFLADTYIKTKDTESAIKEITYAHLLNRNHKDIYDVLKRYRSMDKAWNEWEIAPRCTTYKEGNKVIVKADEKWLGYAMADAVWKYEPGFAKNILGIELSDDNVYYKKEAACLAANLNAPGMENISKIIEEGYIAEMVIYESLSKKAPLTNLMLSKDQIERLVRYINKYH